MVSEFREGNLPKQSSRPPRRRKGEEPDPYASLRDKDGDPRNHIPSPLDDIKPPAEPEMLAEPEPQEVPPREVPPIMAEIERIMAQIAEALHAGRNPTGLRKELARLEKEAAQSH